MNCGVVLDRRCMRLMREFMEWHFVQEDLKLFLDTHPDDEKALRDYQQASRRAMQIKDEFNRTCYALTAEEVTRDDYWQWIESPWPWEIEY